MPKFKLETVEDYYTYYVLILKIPEPIFWNESLGFLKTVVEDKTAYDAWVNYISARERQRTGKK